MRRSPEDLAAREVLREITRGRCNEVQVPLPTMVRTCQLHGLLADLPPLGSGVEKLWRSRILEALGGVRSVDGRRWRVRCPWGGNFRVTPVRRRRTRP